MTRGGEERRYDRRWREGGKRGGGNWREIGKRTSTGMSKVLV